MLTPRRKRAQLNIGTSALGTGGYMCAELFKSLAGIDAQIVPYKGTAPLMNDLVGGHVPIAFGVLPPAMGNLDAGTLRAVAVTGMKRFSMLPDVPTVDESGMPGFDAVLRYGLLAPKGTPQPIIDRLNRELRKLVRGRRGEEAHRNRRRRSADVIARRIRRRHCARGGEVGRAGEEAEFEGGLIPPVIASEARQSWSGTHCVFLTGIASSLRSSQ